MGNSLNLEEVRMVTRNVTVEVPTLDARPTAMLVQLASQYDCTIHITSAQGKFNAKSIMGMMTLGVKTGEELSIETNGKDEQEALDSICNYLENKK